MRRLAALLLPAALAGQAAPAPITTLRIDPLLLGSVQEYRHVVRVLGPALYPGWKEHDVPILLYRPGVQELLLDFPHWPSGFAPYRGRVSPGPEVIYARNDSTVFRIDDQNTSTMIDSLRVLVVADMYSRMRSQMRGAVLGRPAEFVNQWLDGWGFVQSPYEEVGVLLHEAFHVIQERRAPDKSASEMAVAQYPLLDPGNNALFMLEAMALRDALRTSDPATRRARAAQFAAVRADRRSRLDSSFVAYENLNEFSEGTARYVEYKFMQVGEGLTPTPGMYLHNGFEGYRGVLRKHLDDRIADFIRIASVSDNRFGNRFGAGPLRFKLYDFGGFQALLLDQLAPDWKTRIFRPNVFLSGILDAALHQTAEDRQRSLAAAKREYNYDSLLAVATTFEREGKAAIQERVDAILKTDRTLVTIAYGDLGDKIGMSFTPFGVTAITKRSAIYDLVPVAVDFPGGMTLEMKEIVPVLVDRDAKTVTFVAATPAEALGAMRGKLETPQFSLTGSGAFAVSVTGKQVRIDLRKAP